MWTANLDLMARVARALGDLRDEVVFVGGCTTGLLITDPAAPEVRATLDVDVIVEVTNRTQYYSLSDRLRSLEFSPDPEVICRWHSRDGVILDVMPTESSILGFTNDWYTDAIATATEHKIAPDIMIRVVNPPHFCATKLAAFHGRGAGDYAASHDLEDLLAVVDGREELLGELRQADESLQQFVSSQVRAFLRDTAFLDTLPGVLPPDAASQTRLPELLRRLSEISDLTPPPQAE